MGCSEQRRTAVAIGALVTAVTELGSLPEEAKRLKFIGGPNCEYSSISSTPYMPHAVARMR